MDFNNAIENYKTYLVIERSLSENSLDAYLSDLNKFCKFCIESGIKEAEKVSDKILAGYINQLSGCGNNDRTKARIISSLRSFFKYLVKEEYLERDPMETINAPKIVRKSPVTLTAEEIEDIKKRVEMYKPEGQRNKAMIEILYSCGLRVSELINVKLSNTNFHSSTVKVEGEGNKARVLKLNATAKQEIKLYLKNYRDHLDIPKEYEDFLFLNKRGTTLSRVMVFNIIKYLAERAGIKKTISPHTFRHSFAARLVENGTDLQVIRDMLGHESILTTEIYAK